MNERLAMSVCEHFVMELGPVDQLDRIARELGSRRLLVSRRDHSEWIAAVGRDPDGWP
jgi:hypothetical protein